jgi:hypothetical protein
MLIKNRITIKEQLLHTIEELKRELKKVDGSPVTDLEISQSRVIEMEELTKTLEANNPFPRPLFCGSALLNGAWLLQYSTAREIRSLNKLPFGFKVGKIYQVIDVDSASFENKAFVSHISGFLSGYVRVTAIFEADKQNADRLPDQKINVNFQDRFIAISKILGIPTPFFDPIKKFPARNPQGRIPSLNITYIDETMRIGRGGDGSLFILTKSAIPKK